MAERVWRSGTRASGGVSKVPCTWDSVRFLALWHLTGFWAPPPAAI